MAKKAQNDADGMLAAILEGLKPALKSAFENFSFVGEAGADEPKKKYGGVKNKEAKDVEGKYGGIKNAGPDTPGTGKGVTDAVMENARQDPELDKLYEDRFKNATPAAPSGVRGKMFDTTQLPKEAFPKASAPKDPGEGAMASAGRLLNPVAGQRVAEGGVQGGALGETPAADSQTVAMSDTIADLQARLAKMELGGGTTPDYGTPDNPFGAIREPAAPPAPAASPAMDPFEQSFKGQGGAATPPPSPIGDAMPAYGSSAPVVQDDAAIQAAGQQDAANGGGNRGLMAAIGSAFSGAKDAITGGPRPGLKPEYKDLSNNELARLMRQGIDVYESGAKPLPPMGGALSGGPALGSSMGTPMPPSPAPEGKPLIDTWKPSGRGA